MRKFFAALLFVLIILSFALMAHANETVSNTFCFEDVGVEIRFEDDNTLSEAQKEQIAENLAYDLDPVESRAWCWLTGHDKVIHAVTKVTHKVREYSPRCFEEYYNITTCNNCNYYDEERVAYGYILCCPSE